MRPDAFADYVIAAFHARNLERMHSLIALAENNRNRAKREGDWLGVEHWQAQLDEIEARLDALRREAA